MKNQLRTCTHCGHTGEEVRRHFEYVGGQGYISTAPRCQDQTACMARWDRNNGFMDTGAIREIEKREKVEVMA